jgi:DNA-binding NarL/FixJ family response regulator
MAVRVVLAEDNYLLREGMSRLFNAGDDVQLLAACEDYDSLLRACEEHHPDVVVTDIRMPPTGTDEGIRAANELRRLSPDTGVVVLSQYADPEYALALFSEGSEGRAYLLKERVSDVDDLLAAVRAVAEGGSVVDPKIVETLVAGRSRSKSSPLEHLTPRERETLSEMAQGKNNAAIAGSLYLSERAVLKHINSIFSKLGLTEEESVHRRVKAVLLFLAEKPE